MKELIQSREIQAQAWPPQQDSERRRPEKPTRASEPLGDPAPPPAFQDPLEAPSGQQGDGERPEDEKFQDNGYSIPGRNSYNHRQGVYLPRLRRAHDDHHPQYLKGPRTATIQARPGQTPR